MPIPTVPTWAPRLQRYARQQAMTHLPVLNAMRISQIPGDATRGYVSAVMAQPQPRSLRELLIQQSGVPQAMGAVRGIAEPPSGRDLLRQAGIAGQEDTWTNAAGGLLTEMLLDPLNMAGAGAVAGRASKIKAASNPWSRLAVVPMRSARKVRLSPEAGMRSPVVSILPMERREQILLGPRDQAANELFRAMSAYESGAAKHTMRELLGLEPVLAKPLPHVLSRRAPFSFYEYPDWAMSSSSGVTFPAVRNDIAYVRQGLKGHDRFTTPLHEASHLWQTQQPAASRQLFASTPGRVMRMEGARYYGGKRQYLDRLREDAEILQQLSQEGKMKLAAIQGTYEPALGPAKSETQASLIESVAQEGISPFDAPYRIKTPRMNPLQSYLNQVGGTTKESATRQFGELGVRYGDYMGEPFGREVMAGYADKLLDFFDSTAKPPPYPTSPALLEIGGKPIPTTVLRRREPTRVPGPTASKMGLIMSMYNLASRQEN